MHSTHDFKNDTTVHTSMCWAFEKKAAKHWKLNIDGDEREKQPVSLTHYVEENPIENFHEN